MRIETWLLVIHPYVLRGLLYCGICGRKMQAQHNNQRTYYRCRYAKEYALANHVAHPVNVYVREEQLLPAVDGWLLKIFAPHRLAETIRELAATCHPQLAAPVPADDSAAALARAAARPAANGTPLTEDAIQQIVPALGDIRDIIQGTDPASKARIYNRLELRLTYQSGKNLVHAQANLNPRERGGMGSVRGALPARAAK
jgi:site-specific DNA recombinase